MAKKTATNQSRQARRSAAKPTESKADATKEAAGVEMTDDMITDIVILRGLVQRLGAERVIRLVKHFE